MCVSVFYIVNTTNKCTDIRGEIKEYFTYRPNKTRCSKNSVGSSMADCIKLYVKSLYFFFRIKKPAARFGLISKTVGYKPNFELDCKPQGNV